MKILLSGGNGYLGSALARQLVSADISVTLVLRPSSKLDRLRSVENKLNIWRYKNYSELDQIIQLEQPDVVIHTACAYGRAGESYLQITDANIDFGLQIMQSLLQINRTVTFINTGSVLAADVSPYALSKRQFSQWGRMLANGSAGQLRFINILLQHMYGPEDDISKFTSYVLKACKNNTTEIRLTAGEQRRDFIYIEDVVSAFIAIINNREALGSEIDVDVGTGVAPTIRNFVESVHRLTKSTSKLLFGAIPYRANEAMHCQADISLLAKIGWSPQYSLNSGIEKTIQIESKQQI